VPDARFWCSLVRSDRRRSSRRVRTRAAEARALVAKLSEADARRAAEAVLNDPLVDGDERGRPAVREITEFVRAVADAIERRVRHRLTPTITRAAARSANRDHVPGPDIQLILDLLACHAPSKTAEAIANLIKEA
jgi:hypothetical protein